MVSIVAVIFLVMTNKEAFIYLISSSTFRAQVSVGNRNFVQVDIHFQEYDMMHRHWLPFFSCIVCNWLILYFWFTSLGFHFCLCIVSYASCELP